MYCGTSYSGNPYAAGGYRNNNVSSPSVAVSATIPSPYILNNFVDAEMEKERVTGLLVPPPSSQASPTRAERRQNLGSSPKLSYSSNSSFLSTNNNKNKNPFESYQTGEVSFDETNTRFTNSSASPLSASSSFSASSPLLSGSSIRSNSSSVSSTYAFKGVTSSPSNNVAPVSTATPRRGPNNSIKVEVVETDMSPGADGPIYHIRLDLNGRTYVAARHHNKLRNLIEELRTRGYRIWRPFPEVEDIMSQAPVKALDDSLVDSIPFYEGFGYSIKSLASTVIRSSQGIRKRRPIQLEQISQKIDTFLKTIFLENDDLQYEQQVYHFFWEPIEKKLPPVMEEDDEFEEGHVNHTCQAEEVEKNLETNGTQHSPLAFQSQVGYGSISGNQQVLDTLEKPFYSVSSEEEGFYGATSPVYGQYNTL